MAQAHRSGSGPPSAPRRPNVALPLICFAIAGLAGCRSQPSRAGGVRSVQLNEFGGYLELVARQRERDQESKISPNTTRSEETIFEESLKLEVDGYAYHPNFLEFTLGGLFGLLQHEFKEDLSGRRQSSSDDGNIIEFDLSGHFFKKKKYPGTIYARRYRGLEPRSFLSSIETTTTNFGLTWQYVSERTPTSVQFSHTDVELDPLGDEEATGEHKNTVFRFETGYRFNKRSVLSFVYDRESIEQRPFDLDYDTDELTLSHRLDFGSNAQHRLDSELNYYDQRGSFNIERARWREVLRLTHTPNLESWYTLEIASREQGNLSGVPPLEETSYLFSGTLEHRLYESLVTQLSGFIQRQEFKPDLEIDRYGLQASFDYRKKNRWGTLLAAYRARIINEDRTGGEVRSEVLDERHIFRDPEPIVLGNRNVDSGTIFVTSEDALTIYQLGRDFTTRQLGETTELERVPTGRILEGDTLLIDYNFTIGGGFSLDTLGQDFNIRQNFDFGLSPYYRLRWQDQDISPLRATGAIAEDITAHIIGVEYRKGPFRLVAEFEDHDSTVTPFEAIRLSGDYSHRFKFGATGVIKARWSDVDYFEPNLRETRLFSIEGRYRQAITEHLFVEGAVLYRDEKDSLSGPDEGIDLDLTVEWMIRQTEVRVTYEYGEIEDDFSRNDHSTLFVQVRRRF
ncbi:MAG: hypothetical protein GY778_29275 [bacterium]|nr:hypothetical protein [bacterium]